MKREFVRIFLIVIEVWMSEWRYLLQSIDPCYLNKHQNKDLLGKTKSHFILNQKNIAMGGGGRYEVE